MIRKKIVVTGGAGFIGTNLCERLLSLGHSVICIDNLFTGQASNVERLRSYTNFEVIYHDVLNPFEVEADQIYNLACPASPIHYQENPVKTIQTCVYGAFNTLEIARRCGARILQASTSEVYGNPLKHPQVEGYWGNVNPIGIRSCYDEGKRCAETIFMDYHRMYGVDIRLIRIFNTYGPYMAMNDNRVVSNFILQALQQQPITIYGSGSQTRSFQYIDDLVDAMIRMMETPDVIGPVNIGNPTEFTIRELAEKIIDLTGSSSRLQFEPRPSDDPELRRPDISLARERLGWTPTVDLETGLKKTIAYFEQLLNHTVQTE